MSSDEQYRKECEARQVLKWPRERRESFYQGVKEIRGQKTVNELIAEVKKQYQQQLKIREAEISL